MRPSILVYGVLYVVLEMVGHALETVGWGRVTPLHVASALVDALLLIVMAIAALVLWDVGRRRWGPAIRAWQARQIAAVEESREPIGVQSWRSGTEPSPLSLPRAVATAPPTGTGTYGGGGRSRRFREDPGQLL
jgi:hypothetical protein